MTSAPEGQVHVMTAADHGRSAPDLYQLLGVPREASHREIALAWRSRARTEHPDARPSDAEAPARFRALAQAWQVLGDPARRSAYDQALGRASSVGENPAAGTREPTSDAISVPVRHLRGAGVEQHVAWAQEPPLLAGPVRVERHGSASPAARSAEDEIRLAILAQLALRTLRRPW